MATLSVHVFSSSVTTEGCYVLAQKYPVADSTKAWPITTSHVSAMDECNAVVQANHCTAWWNNVTWWHRDILNQTVWRCMYNWRRAGRSAPNLFVIRIRHVDDDALNVSPMNLIGATKCDVDRAKKKIYRKGWINKDGKEVLNYTLPCIIHIHLEIGSI